MLIIAKNTIKSKAFHAPIYFKKINQCKMKLTEFLYHIRCVNLSCISGYILASHFRRLNSIPAEFTYDFKWKSGTRERVSSSSFGFVCWPLYNFSVSTNDHPSLYSVSLSREHITRAFGKFGDCYLLMTISVFLCCIPEQRTYYQGLR